MHLLQHHLKTEADKWCFWATAHSGQRASVTLNENHFVCIEKLKPCYTMFNCMYLSGIFLGGDIYAIGRLVLGSQLVENDGTSTYLASKRNGKYYFIGFIQKLI